MDELCEELRQMHQMRIKNDVKVIFERPAVSLTIVSDSHRLRQLYSNLISNAIKYTEKGSITLGYKLKGDMMEGYVRDTGSGIPAEKLNNVFGRFEKLDLLKQGFGLGLSICKSILDKMGGKIWVESELGVGSCFYFSIPYNGTFPVVGEQNKPLILVAEDMDCNYELVKAILEERYSVLRANDGIDVVTKYESSKPDLILMDVRMPGLDGLSAAGIIRELNSTIPIIATTAFAFETDRGMALAAGCTSGTNCDTGRPESAPSDENRLPNPPARTLRTNRSRSRFYFLSLTVKTTSLSAAGQERPVPHHAAALKTVTRHGQSEPRPDIAAPPRGAGQLRRRVGLAHPARRRHRPHLLPRGEIVPASGDTCPATHQRPDPDDVGRPSVRRQSPARLLHDAERGLRRHLRCHDAGAL